MIVEILTFLTDYKVIVVGAATTLSEVVVVLVNMRRKLKAERQAVETMSAADQDFEKRTRLSRMLSRKNLLWSANPLNLFRQPPI